MSEATARPWHVEIECDQDNDGNELPGEVYIPEINRLLHDAEWADAEDWETDKANAALIVAAVNAHDLAMKLADAALDTHTPFGVDVNNCECPLCKLARELKEAAK
jgi:hypothetical protein